MRYILAVFLPPLAVLISAGLGSALLNLVLTILGYIPGLIHAFIVVNNYYRDHGR